VTCGAPGSAEGNSVNSSVALLEILVAMHKMGKFARFNKDELIHVGSLGGKITVKEVKKIARRVKLLEVTALDLSLPERGQCCELSHHLLVYPKATMSIMPNLHEIDLSNTHYIPASSVCKDIAKKCPSLEKLTRNYHKLGLDTFVGLFKNCRSLAELYMDDSGLCKPARQFGMPSEIFNLLLGCPLLHHCSSKLERVSIKNAGDYAVRPDTGRWAETQR
jgi:hypothetical protein